jgi:hypothetical protein
MGACVGQGVCTCAGSFSSVCTCEFVGTVHYRQKASLANLCHVSNMGRKLHAARSHVVAHVAFPCISALHTCEAVRLRSRLKIFDAPLLNTRCSWHWCSDACTANTWQRLHVAYHVVGATMGMLNMCSNWKIFEKN